MKCRSRTIYIDSCGNASDGTSMYDWSVDRLKEVLDYCWSKTIADLATEILKQQKEKIDKILT